MFQTRICSFFASGCEHIEPVVPLSASAESGLPQLKQPTIKQALGVTRKATERTSFLSLPPAVRRLVYIYADTPFRERISLTSRRHDFYFDEYELDNIQSISLTCHLIFDEVKQFLISENLFVIYLSKASGLRRLRDLKPFLRYLQRLEIHLEFARCSHAGGCRHRYGHDKVSLDCHSRTNVDLYYEWLFAARWLAHLITPRTCELRFHCPVKSLAAARSCLEPCLRLPDLKVCVFNLLSPETAEVVKTEINALAHSVSLHRTAGKSDPSCSSRVRELPTEVWLKILGYTDLVAPYSEVCVDEKCDGTLQYSVHRCFLSCNSVRARAGTCKVDDGLDEAEDYNERQYLPLSFDCGIFCRKKGVGNPQCSCYTSPKALFLVSKKIRLLCLEIFFSRNKFIFSQPFDKPASDSAHVDPITFTLSAFLGQVRRQRSLHLLRKLEVALPALKELAYVDPTVSRDWTSSLETAAPYLRLPSLELTVFIPWDLYWAEWESRVLPFGWERLIPDYIARYEKSLRGLSLLRAMKEFLVITIIPDLYWVCCPNCRFSVGRNRSGPWDPQQKVRHMMQLLERTLEQRVMGEHYVSDPAKKWPRCISQRLMGSINWIEVSEG